MFCELAVIVLCGQHPVDLRSNMIRSRITTSHIDHVAAPVAIPYYVPVVAALPLEVVPIPSKRPTKKRQKKTRALASKGAPPPVQAVAFAPPPKRSLFGWLLQPRNSAKKVPVKARVSRPAVRTSAGYTAVEKAARKYGLDVNLALRMARQESGGNCKARSHADARGVMQVIPSTAAIHGIRGSQLYDCRTGAEAGVREMVRLLRMTRGNVRNALIGYNAGPGWIGKPRIPRETKGYVRAILGRS